MKIVHIISCLGNGGAQRLMFDLAEAQSELNNEVVICSFRDAKENSSNESSGNVQFVSFSKQKGFDFSLSFSLYRFLKKEKPDVVNCHLPSVFLYVILSILLLRKIKFFYTIHNDPIQEEPRSVIRKMRRFFIKRNRLVPIAISDKIEKDFEILYSLSGVETVFNGRKKLTKTADFEKVYQEIQSYKKNSETLVFVSVGRISKVKNHQLLVKVFSELEKQNKNVILVVIGDDYESGILQDCLKIKSDNTFFLGLKQNVPDYLFCSDVFCMSSEYEGLPIAILEALSIGLPVISTNVGGIADVIKDGKNGFLINSLEQSDYLFTVEKYLQLNKDEIQTIVDTNKQLFKDKYDIEKTAKEYVAIYEKYIL